MNITMNFLRTYNLFTAVVLAFVYLSLPATGFARAVSDSDASAAQAAYSQTTSAPCDSCPCSDEQGRDCCDTVSCGCACHAPLGQALQIVYRPLVAVHSFREPTWSLPQVFLSIFVPPQNIL